MLDLFSGASMRVSLDSIRRGIGGLDAHRASMLNRVPEPGDWARFPQGRLEMRDLAYLTAKTGHEFAILRGKSEDILFHGTAYKCTFDDVLVELLLSKRLMIYGHSHPGEVEPTPSKGDRDAMRRIGQRSSHLISGLSGVEIEFTADPFELV